MNEFPLTALLIGLWSAGHCLAMCGGLSIAAGQSNRQNLNNGPLQRGLELLSWQLGRGLSYAFMGAIAGAFGSLVLTAAPIDWLRNLAFVMANLILIGLGLHVAQLYSGVVAIERFGQAFWKLIAPLATATLVPQTPKHRHAGLALVRAVRAGAIWGWLPCGLVYSMLVTASVTGGAAQGSLWMFAFALGTMPALWLTSILSHSAIQIMERKWIRRTAGLVIVAFGLWGLLRASGIVQITWFDAFCIGGASFNQLSVRSTL